MYEIIDHTADIGIRIEAETQEALFLDAAKALFDLMVRCKRDFIPAIEVPIAVAADASDELLVKWLSELLYVFETRRLVLTNFWIDRIDSGSVVGSAKGIKFDDSRHAQKLSIKAVTYHRLEVKQDEAGKWHAQVIFDI